MPALVPTGLVLAAALLAPYGEPEVVFRLPPQLSESSGVATSSTSDDVLFTHQDSGDEARFYALGRDGALLATYRLGVQARDWEDMARGPDEQGRPSLWLGDIGDNREARERGVLVHRVPEPAVEPADPGRVAKLTPTSFRLVYDDGPRDAEALLVHPRTGRLFVVSKEVFRRPGLYAAPERLDPGAPNPLRRVADLDLPLTTTAGGPAQGGAVRVLVTAGDISPDGTRVAVRTYTDLFEWRVDGDDLAAAMDDEPAVTALPPTVQGEGLAYARDGRAVLLTTEGVAAPVHRLPRTVGPAPAPAVPGVVTAGPPYALLVGGALLAGAVGVWRVTRRRRPRSAGR